MWENRYERVGEGEHGIPFEDGQHGMGQIRLDRIGKANR